MKHLFFTFFAALAMLVMSIPATGQVIINEVYGGGGNAGAPYNRDFVELYNTGGTTVDITGWSIQYASATGTFGNASLKLDLPSGSNIAPGGFFLVGLATGSTGASIVSDAAGTAPNLSGTNGKVALVNSTTLLPAVSNPVDASIVDFIGFGTANFFEGAGASPAGSNTTSLSRTGFADTNNNAADFTSGAPSPQGKTSVEDWSALED